jgi:Flp pilus assembly protein TadG
MKGINRLRLFGKERDGGTAAEFALIVLVLCFILFAMIQMGALFYHYNVMQNAARDGARRLAVDNDIYPLNPGAAVNCSTTSGSATVEAYTCSMLRLPDEAQVTACITEDLAGVRYDAEVVVSADMAKMGLIDLFGATFGKTLTATSVMRLENGKDPNPSDSMCLNSIPPLT